MRLVLSEPSNAVPTGKTRHRIHKTLFREPVLVLQVELSYPDGPGDSYGLPEYLAGRMWVDARMEHLSILPNSQS
ncbi:hypothetical protein [Stenotrophomonas phage A1432]|uniref:Uncharacterized protein n=1 Tax=Stenotrophomonas phage A1432 TaxID=2930315 RepID=A0A9E7N141_9CAUD|nr:hypothetical protein P9A45_gp02 [Stenotrophomonas phage A1432]UTC27944.1 hypothetical protein [Stenotrophomonas phage A1432]